MRNRVIESPSIQVLKNALKASGMKRKEFVAAAGLSAEYVSRVVNGKVKFPRVRERLEQFASILGIDPTEFVEYRNVLDYSCPSVELVWHRMRELGLSRSDLADRVDISKTYLYEVLRGDVVFPRNQRIIESLASALMVSPTVFEEYGSEFADWAERYPEAAEVVFLKLLLSGKHTLNLERSAALLGVDVAELSDRLTGV